MLHAFSGGRVRVLALAVCVCGRAALRLLSRWCRPPVCILYVVYNLESCVIVIAVVVIIIISNIITAGIVGVANLDIIII